AALRHACSRARSNISALLSHELEDTVANAFSERSRQSLSFRVRTHSSPLTRPSRSSSPTSTPFDPDFTASAGPPVRVDTTGVRQAIASIAGKLKPSLVLAVSHTSHRE